LDEVGGKIFRKQEARVSVWGKSVGFVRSADRKKVAKENV